MRLGLCLVVVYIQLQEGFEDTKGIIRIVNRRRTDNTMAKRKIVKGQTTIYTTYTKNLRSNNTNLTKNRR